MPRTSRPALALLSALSVLTPASLRAQDATPAAPVETAPPRPTPPSPPPRAPEENVGPLILRNETREQVLDLYERWTGKTLLRPQSLPEASITLSLDKPLPKSEALRALETLLNMQGIGFSPLGDRFIKVAPLNLIRTESPEFIDGSTLGMAPSGRVAAKLFSLNFLRAAEFIPQISQLLSPSIGAAPIVFEKSNSVLLTETISNLQRVEQLVATLDRPVSANSAVKGYTIVNAKASDVANKLRTILGGPLAAQIGTATTYQADDRTNQLLLISDPREQPFFDDLIARLDTEASPNTRSEVIFLKHANAPDVEALLAKLVTGQSTASQREGGSSSRMTTRLNPATPATPAGGPAAPAAPVAPPAVVGGANTPASEEFSSLLTIVSDERSNAIVVAGTPNDIKLVTSLVNRLDVLLAQVRIEVVVAEVTLADDATSGISALGLRVEDNKLTGFSSTFAGGSVGGSATGGFADIVKSGSGYDLSGIVSLSTTPRKNNASILQTPSIVTTHNKEAEIFVGETRPVISGTTSGSSGASTGLTTSSTVTQQEIGIRLKVLPLIGSSGDVQLEVEQEVEDVLGTVQIDGNDQPRIGRRTTTSYVSARNGDIIVLGGLQRASQSKTTSRLGPIPFLGDLLGTRSRSKGRTELIFFLRPLILTNTYLDNVEAMKRIDSTPQAKQVREIVDHRPAAAPPAREFVSPFPTTPEMPEPAAPAPDQRPAAVPYISPSPEPLPETTPPATAP